MQDTEDQEPGESKGSAVESKPPPRGASCQPSLREKAPLQGRASDGILMALAAVVVAQILIGVTKVIFDEPGTPAAEELAIEGLSIWLAFGWTPLFYLPPMAACYQDRGLTETRKGVLWVCAVLFFATSPCGTMMG